MTIKTPHDKFVPFSFLSWENKAGYISFESPANYRWLTWNAKIMQNIKYLTPGSLFSSEWLDTSAEQVWNWAGMELSRYGIEQVWNWAGMELSRYGIEQVWNWAGMELGRYGISLALLANISISEKNIKLFLQWYMCINGHLLGLGGVKCWQLLWLSPPLDSLCIRSRIAKSNSYLQWKRKKCFVVVFFLSKLLKLVKGDISRHSYYTQGYLNFSLCCHESKEAIYQIWLKPEEILTSIWDFGT